MRKWRDIVSVFMLFFITGLSSSRVHGVKQVPCYFVMGDSLSSNGNNNNLPTLAKANYKPYGIDFRGGNATGRFSNGRNFVDVITELLGFNNYIPPFKDLSGRDISEGVNYASGAAGILPESGVKLGGRISFGEQIQNHATIVATLKLRRASKHLKKCLYTVAIGSNDYINNYFMDGYPSSNIYNPTEFASLLIRRYNGYMERMHKLGARKLALFGLGSIGCTLGSIAKFGPSEGSVCVEKINNATAIFNDKLVLLVDKLNNKFKDAKFIYINATAVQFTPAQGFTVFGSSCCQPRSDGQCEPNTTPCENRSQYLFWDLYHPTEAANVITANSAYNAQDPNAAYPIDISSLVRV